jgi:hypothetical protein
MKQIEDFRTEISDIAYSFELQLTRYHFLWRLNPEMNVLPRIDNNLGNQPI